MPRPPLPVEALPDGVGICDLFEIVAGHGEVGEVLDAEVAGALSQRIHVQIGDGCRRRRRRPLVPIHPRRW